ncbi:MAG: YafY family protein [Pseudotabrizicola sp.]|uniref:helix-turn-helix transcriptional regulator n=1 Tax=Pseudotabrizicola sp. TaxID=2939647 RepID=UPI002715C5C9|nr:YafY family protein [Pseudotabrizicola sp.]MDO8881850.1 YafY family protein [Pseudotabrizicola sp.]MDP2083100.1 YafY family protein [Pseudotabrizicola sp.]MDZ7572518.1 YafY family protein [Pseudotabrizicola sp.]
MRRTDRLFDLIQILRDGRLHRAGEMATRLGVSVRTIWRDMATLMASGLPVEGERGVGYILRAPITLPPMILTGAELDALRAGVRLVAAGPDQTLARAARILATKIASVTPAPPEADADDLFVFTGKETNRATAHVPLLRRAIKARQRLTLTYIDPEGRETHRDIRPLALDLTGRIWTLGAWCEQRSGFRSFRVDRIMAMDETGETYPNERGKTLADYRALMSGEG